LYLSDLGVNSSVCFSRKFVPGTGGVFYSKDKFLIILLAVSSDIKGCLGTWSLFPVLGWPRGVPGTLFGSTL